MSSPRSIPTVDGISALPDNIICHTLSFLPTKQSATTSILSKRWYPLWHSVLTLDFDDQNFTDFATFSRFVYSVMLSRNITLPLQSFRLKCGSSSGFNPHDVNIFIEAAVQRGVENLDIDMSHRGYSFKLPLCVFSCSNLTVLKLKAIKMHELFNVNFPLLKTLHLEAIDFKDSNGRSLWILLYGCPILEELQTNGFLFRRKLKAGRDFNGLHKLVRANIMNLGCSVPFDLVRNAKFLRAKLNHPNYDYQVPTFPNLTHMEIAFDTYEWPGKWKLLTEVLQNCPKLQSLTIHEDYKYRQEIGDNNWVDPPIVSECLSSQLRTCSIIGYKGMKCELQFVEYILKNTKVLHTMKINASLVDINMKYQMLMKLSLCPRGSTTCVLSFD